MTGKKPPGKQAATAGSLEALQQRMRGCRECPLGEIGTQVVSGEGSRTNRLMLVGEAPGDHEDIQGRPFVGPAGRLLDAALERLGDRFAPPELLRRMVADGRLGRKTGRGFYEWSE